MAPQIRKEFDGVRLDGRVGEGGGQIIRIAVPLAALTGTPLRIDNVRGNRPGKGGGGLKAQHVAGIRCLANATRAEISGVSEGSKSFNFKAKLSPKNLVSRNIWVKAESAASIPLVFQAILPFFIFAGNEEGSPITVTIEGGTNVSFSLSFEYLNQVLLPALERFGVKVERKLEMRGWSHGTRQLGSVKFIISPLSPRQCLSNPNWPAEQGSITHIDISIVVPSNFQETLKKSLRFELGLVFPGVKAEFKVVDDSRHPARIYTLLVAHTSTALRFGRDWLYNLKTKNKSVDDICTAAAQRVVDQLDTEIRKGGVVDEHLQDQLVIFQALADGKSSIPECEVAPNSFTARVNTTDEPFGHGSTHTTTARWVASEILPNAKWFAEGVLCDGVGWKA